MTFKQLQKLVKKGESENLEFKKSTANLSAAMETVCAFLNSDRGGTVLIGVKDDGTIVGQDVNDKNLQDLAAEIKRIEPLAKFDINYVSLENDKKVIVFSVFPGERAPYSYDGRSFIRIQSTTLRMQQDQYDYLYNKSNPIRWESLTNNYKISDLDETRIKSIVRLAIAHGRISAIAEKSSVKDILTQLELMKNEKLTNAAVVLFAKPDSEMIQSNLKLARFNGIDKKSFYDNKFFKANAFDLYDKAMDFLHFHLPLSGRIEPGKSERVEIPAIPYTVLREAVTNALIHRDYSFAGGSMSIARYDDRVEIDNTGSLLTGLSVKKLEKKHRSVLRNPLIANIFFICGKIERWGRGTIDMIEDCHNAGNPLPIYEDSGYYFSVTLPLKDVVPSIIFEPQQYQFVPKLTDKQYKILESLKSGALTHQQIEDSIAIKILQRELLNLKDMALLKTTGKGKDATWQLI